MLKNLDFVLYFKLYFIHKDKLIGGIQMKKQYAESLEAVYTYTHTDRFNENKIRYNNYIRRRQINLYLDNIISINKLIYVY